MTNKDLRKILRRFPKDSDVVIGKGGDQLEISATQDENNHWTIHIYFGVSETSSQNLEKTLD